MLRRIVQKILFSVSAFAGGMIWGIAAEASAAGIPLIGLFQG